MLEVTVSHVKAALSEYLNRAAHGRERIVISSRGKPEAAMIGIDDLRRLEELEDALAAVEALEAYEAGDTVPWDQIKIEKSGKELIVINHGRLVLRIQAIGRKRSMEEVFGALQGQVIQRGYQCIYPGRMG